MQRSGSPPTVDDVKERLTVLLEAAGFSAPSPTQWAQGRGFARWARSSSWKHDIFEIDYPRRGPLAIGAKTMVTIIIPTSEIIVDTASVPFISGRQGDYRWSPSSEAEAFLRMITEDAAHALTWFQPYLSPASALEAMNSSVRNGCRKGTVAYEATIAFLKSRVAA
jgi:hypothetical protein